MKRIVLVVISLIVMIGFSGCGDKNLPGLVKHMKENAPYDSSNPPVKMNDGRRSGAIDGVKFVIASDVVYYMYEWESEDKVSKFMQYQNGKFGLNFSGSSTPKRAIKDITSAFKDY